ncbi:MAG: RHS repeat-associated core domain-containing protein, partial [Clostridia bacterium]|nr:RHS repeat-associated core domain-containing protein [Clostridia bacterium]
EKLYFYKKNLQGDVIAIYDEDGHKVAGYVYDAWGKCTITTNVDGIATFNPIRYRGYYYDVETGLYYLESRYYDPETGRFINADSISVIFLTPMNLYHKNLYSYCDNNPIVRVDFGGAFWHIIVGAVVGGIVSGVTTAVSTCLSKEGFDLKDTLISVAVGAVSGGLTAAAPGSSIAISAVSSAAESVIGDVIDGESPAIIITDAVISAGLGAVSGSWGDDVVNPSLYDDAIDSIAKTVPGNHPKVKNDAKKVIKGALKQAKKDVVNELVTNSSIEVINRATKAVTKCYVNYIW